MSRLDLRLELNIFPHIEPIRDMVEIFFYLGLSWESFFPGPVIVEFFREIENVNPTLAVCSRSGIPVPVTG